MTPPAPPGAKGKVTRRQLVIGAAAVGGVVLVALFMRSRAGSGAAGSTGYTDTGTATPYTYAGAGGFPNYDQQIAALDSQLLALSAAQREQEQDITRRRPAGPAGGKNVLPTGRRR